MPWVTQAEFAREMGVSQEAVAKAIKGGRVVSWQQKNKRVVIDSEKAKKEWEANTTNRKTLQTVMAGSQGPTINQSRTVLEAYRAKMAKVEYEAKIGTLVLAETVKKQAFACAREARDRLMNIPDRVAGLVAAESNERSCHEILMREIRAVCEDLLRAGEDKGEL